FILRSALLAEDPVPATKTEAVRDENAVVDVVAERLGNTRSICKSSYISPKVFDAFRSGALAEGWRRNRARWRNASNPDERLFLWLVKQPETSTSRPKAKGVPR